jgi:nuclear pore complex protein Nup160
MHGNLLVATQLSSLFPASQAICITVPTARPNTLLPSAIQDSDLAPEHATRSAVLHTPTTGTILLRVLHAGLILELSSLSTNVAPLRFILPALALPSPAVFLVDAHELHVLAITTNGSLYRIVIPVGENLSLWRVSYQGVWTKEYLIKNYAGSMSGVVHVVGTHCVAMGLPNGSLLRLDAEYLGTEGLNGVSCHSCSDPLS